jgi:hypothetical protein
MPKIVLVIVLVLVLEFYASGEIVVSVRREAAAEGVNQSASSVPLRKGFEYEHEHDNEHDLGVGGRKSQSARMKE